MALRAERMLGLLIQANIIIARAQAHWPQIVDAAGAQRPPHKARRKIVSPPIGDSGKRREMRTRRMAGNKDAFRIGADRLRIAIKPGNRAAHLRGHRGERYRGQ